MAQKSDLFLQTDRIELWLLHRLVVLFSFFPSFILFISLGPSLSLSLSLQRDGLYKYKYDSFLLYVFI
jgi:hypothetical protein